MNKYILQRLSLMVPVLIGTSLVVFVIVRLLPGDPAIAMLGTSATPDELVRMRHLLGLDQPVYIQYLRFVADIAHGDFGNSISRGTPALDVVLGTLPATIELAITSMLLSIAIAVPLGVLAAVRQHSILDYGSMVLALMGVSMPIFWLGILLILMFSLQLHLLSAFGRGEPLTVAFFKLATTGDASTLIDSLKHIILPAVAGCEFDRIDRASLVRPCSRHEPRLCAHSQSQGAEGSGGYHSPAIRNAFCRSSRSWVCSSERSWAEPSSPRRSLHGRVWVDSSSRHQPTRFSDGPDRRDDHGR
jgi:ABC-type microcin C transport system permease subunit YejB